MKRGGGKHKNFRESLFVIIMSTTSGSVKLVATHPATVPDSFGPDPIPLEFVAELLANPSEERLARVKPSVAEPELIRVLHIVTAMRRRDNTDISMIDLKGTLERAMACYASQSDAISHA